jgi:hypothetical protein
VEIHAGKLERRHFDVEKRPECSMCSRVRVIVVVVKVMVDKMYDRYMYGTRHGEQPFVSAAPRSCKSDPGGDSATSGEKSPTRLLTCKHVAKTPVLRLTASQFSQARYS